MFLFENMVSKKTALCTGDFKYEKDQPECAGWEAIDVTKLFVDTTYLSMRQEFIRQSDAISQTLTALKKHFIPS